MHNAGSRRFDNPGLGFSRTTTPDAGPGFLGRIGIVAASYPELRL